MKTIKTFIAIILFTFGWLCSDLKAQLPVWFDGGIGIGIPAGGKHFNADISHYPGPDFYIIGQTTWNHNWFDLDSLIIGAEFSSHFFNARNQVFEENLRFNSLFVNLSRFFSYKNYRPFCNISLGISTMVNSDANFVISMGGVVRAGVFLEKVKFSPGLSLGYNAPWIANHNTLTGFWELTLHVRFLSNYKLPHKQKQFPSYETN
jgi:hypothetical protein